MKSEWRTEKLGEVSAFLNRGGSPRYLEEGGICVLGQRCVRNHRIEYQYSRRHDVRLKPVGEGRYVQAGDVLVNSTGVGSLGRVGQVREAPPEPTTVDSHVTIVRPLPGKFFVDFFGYMLVQIEDAITEAGEGCGGQTELNRRVLAERFSVSYPTSIDEQQRIVGKLDAAFAALTEAQAHVERNRTNARELFESYLNGVFTEEKRDWPERKLGELTERITKGSSPKWQGISYVDEPGVLFVTSENVGEFGLLLDEPKYVEERFNAKDKKSILRNGDVLTNIVGASIGRTAIYNIDTVANLNQAVCLIRCLPDVLSNAYLTYLLNSPFFKAILHDNEVDNARANLSLGFFSNLVIPVPSMKEQNAVIEKMNRFREEYLKLETTYQQKQTELAGLKKAVLGAAFRGEL